MICLIYTNGCVTIKSVFLLLADALHFFVKRGSVHVLTIEKFIFIIGHLHYVNLCFFVFWDNI